MFEIPDNHCLVWLQVSNSRFEAGIVDQYDDVFGGFGFNCVREDFCRRFRYLPVLVVRIAASRNNRQSKQEAAA